MASVSWQPRSLCSLLRYSKAQYSPCSCSCSFLRSQSVNYMSPASHLVLRTRYLIGHDYHGQISHGHNHRALDHLHPYLAEHFPPVSPGIQPKNPPVSICEFSWHMSDKVTVRSPILFCIGILYWLSYTILNWLYLTDYNLIKYMVSKTKAMIKLNVDYVLTACGIIQYRYGVFLTL